MEKQNDGIAEYIFQVCQNLRLPENQVGIVEPDLVGGRPGLRIGKVDGMDRSNIPELHRSLIDPTGEILERFGWLEIMSGGQDIIDQAEVEELLACEKRIDTALDAKDKASVEAMRWRVKSDRNTSQLFHSDAFVRRPKYTYYYLPQYEGVPRVERNGVLGIADELTIMRQYPLFVRRLLSAFSDDSGAHPIVLMVRHAMAKLRSSSVPTAKELREDAIALSSSGDSIEAILDSLRIHMHGQLMLHRLYDLWANEKVCTLMPYRIGGVKIIDNLVMAHAGVASVLGGLKSAQPILHAISPD